jgi:superfamily I DNA/RNA helicase
VRLAGLGADVYSGYLRAGGSLENYNIFFYEQDLEQLDRLAQLLREFKSRGYKPSEITLLSFRADHLSAAMRLKQAGYKLRPAWQSGSQTAYASIHAFKGMEGKVVILTDMLLEDHEFHRDVFYTGMTRATESVRVLCDKRSQETLHGWLGGKAAV